MSVTSFEGIIENIQIRLLNNVRLPENMNSLAIETQESRAQHVSVDENSLWVDLIDGRTIIVPLVWYARLWHGTPEERSNFEIISDGTIIHWPDLDEDLSVFGLLAGRRSSESQQSLKKWLEARAQQGK